MSANFQYVMDVILKNAVVVLFSVLFSLPLAALERLDTTAYTFQFVPGQDMFFVPWGGNEGELVRLLDFVEQYKPSILAGDISIYVDGYSSAGESDTEKLALAKVRSNRVKSELIVRQGLTEECFITHNHSGNSDYVAVRINIPSGFPRLDKAKEDFRYVFHFVPGKDMFFVPWGGNGDELTQLLICVEQHKTEILTGKLSLHVDGYTTGQGSEVEDLAMSKIRSNRVKSELIVRRKLTEECFITHNHSGGGNYVVVQIKDSVLSSSLSREKAVENIPDMVEQDLPKVALETQVEIESFAENLVEKNPLETEKMLGSQMRLGEKTSDEEETSVVEALTERMLTQPVLAELSPIETVQKKENFLQKKDEVVKNDFSLRVNLLRWATLTPDLGVEWRIHSSWSVLVSGSWSTWTWKGFNRRYALWEVMPEARYYLGGKKDWYVGVMVKAGQFNYKLSDAGRQGDMLGGGITGGYKLSLSDALSMDFTLGVGYLHAACESYKVMDGVRVRSGNETKHWLGPIHAGVTLVWELL